MDPFLHSAQLARRLNDGVLVACIGPELSRFRRADQVQLILSSTAATPAEVQDEVRRHLGAGDSMAAMTALSRVHGDGFREDVRAHVDRPAAPPPRALVTLGRLAPWLRHVLTVSFSDRWLGDVLGDGWTPVDTPISSCLHTGRTIIRLCGDPNTASSWRITSPDFAQARSDDLILRRLLTTLAYGSVILFLGFDARDRLLLHILDLADLPVRDPNCPRHFAVVDGVPDLALEAEYRARGGQFVSLGERSLDEWVQDLAVRCEQQAQESRRRRSSQQQRLGCPFPGLRPYVAEERDVFFGRTADLYPLLQKFRPPRDRWLMLDGPSGAGKSSFLHAALVPSLLDGRPDFSQEVHPWMPVVVRPGPRPLQALAEAVQAALGADDPLSSEAMQARAGEFGAFLRRRAPPDRRVLLIVDALEEALLTGAPAEIERFDEALHLALDPMVPLCLITAIRSDFFERFQRSMPALARVMNTAAVRYTLAPLADEALREVIEEPARAFDREHDRALVERILVDVRGLRRARSVPDGADASVPLMAHVLHALWSRSRDPSTIADYDALGGVQGALARSAGALWNSLAEDQRPLADRLLLALVEVRPDTTRTRRSRTRAELLELDPDLRPEAVGEVLGWLSGGRTRGGEPCVRLINCAGDGDGAEVQLVHEIVLDCWPHLHELLQREAAEMRGRYDLRYRAREWQRHDRAAGALPGGTVATYLLSVSATDPLEREFQAAMRRHEGDMLALLERALLDILPVLRAVPGTETVLSQIRAWMDQLCEALTAYPKLLRHLHGGLKEMLTERPRRADELSDLLAVTIEFKRLAETHAVTPGSARDITETLQRIGDLFREHGRKDDARDLYRDALARVDRLLEVQPEDPTLRHQVVMLHLRLGELALSGRLWDAVAAHCDAADALLSTAPRRVDPESRRLLAVVEALRGDMARERGELEAAEEGFERARRGYVALADEAAEPQAILPQLSIVLNKLGAVALDRGHHDEARRHFAASEAVCRRLHDDPSHGLAVAEHLAHALEFLGEVDNAVGALDDAAKRLAEAREIRRRRITPSDLAATERLGEAAFKLGLVELRRKRLQPADEALAEALGCWRELLGFRPEEATLNRRLAATWYVLGEVAAAKRDFDRARRVLEDALSVRVRLLEAGDEPGLCRELAETYERLAELEPEKNVAAAEAYSDQALSHWKALASRSPELRSEYLRRLQVHVQLAARAGGRAWARRARERADRETGAAEAPLVPYDGPERPVALRGRWSLRRALRWLIGGRR